MSKGWKFRLDWIKGKPRRIFDISYIVNLRKLKVSQFHVDVFFLSVALKDFMFWCLCCIFHLTLSFETCLLMYSVTLST